MTPQLAKRLRHGGALLRRASQRVSRGEATPTHSWFRIAMFGGTASAYLLLSENRSQTEEVDQNFQNRRSTSPPGTPLVATSTIPSFLPPTSVPYTGCEGSFKSKFSVLGQNKSLKRSNTILQYQNEVSSESLRSRYKVEWKKPLGQGGFGAVYAAIDRKTGEEVALKQISKKYTDNVGFQREMEALLHLRRHGGHPNICGLRENFDEGNYYYFSMDLVSGGEMFDHLIRSGPYSEIDAARLVREVASALNFMHGIGCVHGDLKPENLMLSTENTSDAVVKLIDFGCAQVTQSEDEEPGVVGLTAAYSSPEMLSLPPKKRKRIDPPLDMWALGIILHIMLVGCHPYDISGEAPDTKIASLVTSKKIAPTLEKESELTAHLSDAAVDLLRKLLNPNPKKRITAAEMLRHPWVRGEAALKNKISGSDEKLSKFRVFKSRLEAKVFEDIISWAEGADSDMDEAAKRTSLIERAFKQLDEEQKGFISAKDLRKITGASRIKSNQGDDDNGSEQLSLSAFSSLLSDNMKDRYYPKGKVLYKEGEIGNSMLFINSGMLEVNTKDGYKVQVKAGNFIGEGALISPDRTRNATVRCLTPVHAIEISRETFEKYLSSSESRIGLNLREKDKRRALKRTKNILRRQRELTPLDFQGGDYIFREGDDSDAMFIVEDGRVNNMVGNHLVATTNPGEMFGAGSLIVRRKRNSSALCASRSCRIQMMKAEDFFEFMDSSPILKASVNDVFLRREFEKAVAHKTKKTFPMSKEDLKEVFDLIDTHGDGYITLEDLRALLLQMDKGAPEELIKGILNSLDIDNSGVVDFGEFCQIFGNDIVRSHGH